MMGRIAAVAALSMLLGALGSQAEQSTLMNPTKRDCANDVLRLKTLAPGPAGTFTVKEDGTEVPYQVEQIDGKNCIWVCSNFAPQTTHTYDVAPGKPKAFPAEVSVKKDGASYVLGNGLTAVRIPAQAANGIPGPISAVRLPGGTWVGGSAWTTSRQLKQFAATVIGDGTVLGKVRLRYDFEGMAGIDGDVPAFAEIDVALGPGWQHVELFERHEMSRADYWEFDASKGWAPRQGISKRFSGGFGPTPPPADRELKPVVHPSLRPDMYIDLFPRWNQHFKDGWAFAATDGQNAVGAMVVRAGKWVWPHNNAIEAIVKPSGDYAGLRCSTWKGQRLWWLLNSATPINTEYLNRYALESLDKLNQEFVLEWPGKPAAFWGMSYMSGDVNPTGGIRGAGKSAMANAGKPGDTGTLIRMQSMMNPDSFGSYWNYWSPENPNFFTDFYKIPVALASNLKDHPQFERFRKMAEMKFREDLYHSITMPGGAGQECPGYMDYALNSNLVELANVCRENLGFDPMTWDRFQAGQRFLRRITQPDYPQRRMLPMGDTHPGKGGGPRFVDVPADEVKSWKTEELPGFGAIFTNNPGTDKETYLAFKSGPNRGHYHGDQLAFHYGANGHPLVVDHYCSYHPRAGQEHMHNRLAFFTDDMPYANMDGYERLIAFKTSADVDIAVGQVESERLRKVQAKLPEDWDARYPELRFVKPLVYRRTVVFMKNGEQDYFVFRDQYWADRPLHAAYCLHTYGNVPQQKGQLIDFGKLSLFCATPQQFTVQSFPVDHENGGGEHTEGVRLEVTGQTGEFITVMYPGKAPAISAIPGGVKVGNDEITFAGNQPTAGDAATYVTVKRGGRAAMTLAGQDIDLDRSQGEVGLFVPDAGYPFGEIPDWLVKQRGKRPDWAK